MMPTRMVLPALHAWKIWLALLLALATFKANKVSTAAVAEGVAGKRFRKNNSNSDSNMKTTITLLLAIGTLAADNLAAKSKPNAAGAPADPGWPRERTNEQ